MEEEEEEEEVEEEAVVVEAGAAGRKAPWLLRPQLLPRELALSSPDLARLPSPPEPGPRSALTLLRTPAPRAGTAHAQALGGSSSCLLAAAQRSSCSSSTRRTLTDSMESVDLSVEASSPSPLEVFDPATLARSHGLNVSLYAPGGGGGGGGDGGGGGGAQGSSSAPSDHAEQPRGSVSFTASYLHKNKKLSMQLSGVQGLPPKGRDGEYEAVVRLSLLPGEKQAKTSRAARGGACEELFNFKVKEPQGRAVRLSAYNAQLQGKHDAIGHALFNVEEVAGGKTRRCTLRLSAHAQLEPCFGSLQVYLQLSQERLIVDIIQARNLSANHIIKDAQSGEKFSTYIKITLYCAGQKVKSKKSPVVAGGRNPRYEFSCDFKVLSDCMDACYLVLSVVLKVNMRKDVTLGRYIFGPYFFSESRDLTPWGRLVVNQEEVHHWFHLHL